MVSKDILTFHQGVSFIWLRSVHKMMIINIIRNIDQVSGFPDIVLGDNWYRHESIRTVLHCAVPPCKG